MSRSPQVAGTLAVSLILLTILVPRIFGSAVGEFSLSSLHEEGATYFNPQFTPFESLVSIQKQLGDRRELILMDINSGTIATKITALPVTKSSTHYELEPVQPRSPYEYALTWQPPQRNGHSWCVFVSGGQSRNTDLYAALVSKTSVQRLVRITTHPSPDFNPAWSPDGTQLLFVSACSGNGDLYLIANFEEWLNRQAPAGPTNEEPELIRLTVNEQEDLFPAWSPEGDRIAYSAYESELGGTVKTFGINLLSLSPKGSKPIRLTRTENLEELHPSWSASGKLLCCHVPLALTRYLSPDYSNSRTSEPEPMTAWLMFITATAGSESSESVMRVKGPGDIQTDSANFPIWLPTEETVLYWTVGTHGYPILCKSSAWEWLHHQGATQIILDDQTLKQGLSVSADGTRALFIKQKGHDFALVILGLESPAP